MKILCIRQMEDNYEFKIDNAWNRACNGYKML